MTVNVLPCHKGRAKRISTRAATAAVRRRARDQRGAGPERADAAEDDLRGDLLTSGFDLTATGDRAGEVIVGADTVTFSRIDDVDGLREALRATVAPTEEQAEIAAVVEDLDLPGAAARMVARRLPRFLYFDEYSELPGRVSIAHLRSTDEE
ncbi:MAG: hypothetical protein AAFZ07_30195, partial [Actinomycetota bacterium]